MRRRRRLRSNAPMEDSRDRTEQRLTALEIKSAYAEDALDQLNDVVVRQQRQIDALLRALAELRERGAAAEADASTPGAADERPPHY